MAALADAYADRVEASAGHRYQLKSVIRSLGQFVSTEPRHDHLNEVTVNGYVAWLRANGRADSYRRSRLTYLLLLWRDLADDGEIPPPKRKKLTRVRVADRITRTMTIGQVRQLLPIADASKAVTGMALAEPDSGAAIFVLLGIAGCAGAIYCDCERTALPRLVPSSSSRLRLESDCGAS